MKNQLLCTFFILFGAFQLSAQCHTITLPYGQVQTDINRGYKIIATQDGHFVIAGEWNNEAYLLKVNHLGQQLALQKFGTAIGGQSKFKDVVEAPDGGFVAVGQCDNCTLPNDSLIKVVAVKTDANLNLNTTIGVKKFGFAIINGNPTIDERVEPSLVRIGNTYTMAASVNVGGGLNPQDVVVTRLSENLQPVWEKTYHTGFFESPFDIVATNDGFIMPVNRAFVATAILLKIDQDGNMQWGLPFETALARNMVYLPATNEVVVVGDRVPAPDNRDAFLMRFNAATGEAVDFLTWGDARGDEGHDVHLLENGRLQVAVRSNQPNPFGTYGTSRVYQVQSHPLQVLCYEKIPNPDNITNMSLSSIVPLSTNGKDFAVTGIRGFYNRTFCHIREDCEVNEQEVSICSGDSYTLPDGQMVSSAGIYQTTLQGIFGCDSVIQTKLSFYPAIAPTTVQVFLCPGDSHTLPDGQMVSSAGIYQTTVQSILGCDSVIQTQLNIYPAIAPTTLQVFLCPGDSHTLPDGQMVSAAGVYPTILQTVNDCDSLIQTTVTVSAIITVDSVHIQHNTGSGNGAVTLQQVSGGTAPYTFQWSNNASGHAIGSLSPGDYQVTIQDASGCAQVFMFTVDMQVATDEPQSGLTFIMYPNPFVERIEVVLEMEQPTNARYELRFMDAQGRLCRTYTLRQGVSELLDSGSLPAGIYMAQLLENGRVVRNSRVNKVRSR